MQHGAPLEHRSSNNPAAQPRRLLQGSKPARNSVPAFPGWELQDLYQVLHVLPPPAWSLPTSGVLDQPGGDRTRHQGTGVAPVPPHGAAGPRRPSPCRSPELPRWLHKIYSKFSSCWVSDLLPTQRACVAAEMQVPAGQRHCSRQDPFGHTSPSCLLAQTSVFWTPYRCQLSSCQSALSSRATSVWQEQLTS